MAARAQDRLLTADEFLRIDFGPDLKAELENGVIRMMGGGVRQHSEVQMNLYRFFGVALRGSGCRPHGSDMAVKAHESSVRYPDLTIDCATRDGAPKDKVLTDPRAIVEVLSPSTRNSDLNVKLREYRAIESVRTIVFIDAEDGTLAVTDRTADQGWTDLKFARDDLRLTSFDLTMPYSEIFARD